MIFKNPDPSITTKIFTGKDALITHGSAMKQLGNRCLIITGKNSAKLCGALDDAYTALKEAEIKYTLYDKITANPTLSQCIEAGTLACRESADFIMAIGGGSAIDAAKAAAILAANPDTEPLSIFNGKGWENTPIAVVAVGTTAGTGTEVSRAAVITVENTGLKTSISSEECLPAISYCDPKYTYCAGYDLTVSTALDALSHATEGWFNKNCDSMARNSAEICLPHIWSALKGMRSGRLPSNEVRDTLYYCSLYAGVVLRMGTTYPHGIGYILTENYSIPHGVACAVFLPHLLEWSLRNAPKAITQGYLDLLGTDLNEFKTVITDLVKLPKITMTDSEIKKYSARWQDNVSKFKKVYGDFTKETAAGILKSMFGE